MDPRDEQQIRTIIGRELHETERGRYESLTDLPPEVVAIVAAIVKRDRILACEYLSARVPDASSMDVKLAASRIDRDS